MKLSKALKLLKKGASIKRPEWDYAVTLQSKGNPGEEALYRMSEDGRTSSRVFVLHAEDILADDWITVAPW